MLDAVLKALEENSGCCLDNAPERQVVAVAIVAAVEESYVFCADCAHLDEVHLDGGCLGGPISDCPCDGFKDSEE